MAILVEKLNRKAERLNLPWLENFVLPSAKTCMSRLSRKPVQQPNPHYSTVPTTSPQRVSGSAQYPISSQTNAGEPRTVRSPSKRLSRRTSGGHSSQNHSSQNHSSQQHHHRSRNAAAMGVATGNVGEGYGPYSVRFSVTFLEQLKLTTI